jgi:hypothetical protein
MGPVGSTAGKEFFDKNLVRIANGDLENDEMLGLLKKGEAVLTPDQLNNIVSALNYSLNTIDELNNLQGAVYTLGQLTGIGSLGISDKANGGSYSFGDITIQMNGVNDVNSFSAILKDNIKSIFAQTIANR